MDALSKAYRALNKLQNVRVVYLPPMTVATARAAEENAQELAWRAITDFVEQHRLFHIKPDLRVFRFDNVAVGGQHYDGHEVWVSVPDDFDVPPPLQKKDSLAGNTPSTLLATTVSMPNWGCRTGSTKVINTNSITMGTYRGASRQ